MSKAISLWQPWASAIAIGAKRIETRSWSTRYRGPIAIHAAKTDEGLSQIFRNREDYPNIIAAFAQFKGQILGDVFPLGAFVAIAELVDCLPVHEIPCVLTLANRYERDLGDYSPGRYGWILDNIKPLPEPIPYRGQQGLWTVPEGVL